MAAHLAILEEEVNAALWPIHPAIAACEATQVTAPLQSLQLRIETLDMMQTVPTHDAIMQDAGALANNICYVRKHLGLILVPTALISIWGQIQMLDGSLIGASSLRTLFAPIQSRLILCFERR